MFSKLVSDKVRNRSQIFLILEMLLYTTLSLIKWKLDGICKSDQNRVAWSRPTLLPRKILKFRHNAK